MTPRGATRASAAPASELLSTDQGVTTLSTARASAPCRSTRRKRLFAGYLAAWKQRRRAARHASTFPDAARRAGMTGNPRARRSPSVPTAVCARSSSCAPRSRSCSIRLLCASCASPHRSSPSRPRSASSTTCCASCTSGASSASHPSPPAEMARATRAGSSYLRNAPRRMSGSGILDSKLSEAAGNCRVRVHGRRGSVATDGECDESAGVSQQPAPDRDARARRIPISIARSLLICEHTGSGRARHRHQSAARCAPRGDLRAARPRPLRRGGESADRPARRARATGARFRPARRRARLGLHPAHRGSHLGARPRATSSWRCPRVRDRIMRWSRSATPAGRRDSSSARSRECLAQREIRRRKFSSTPRSQPAGKPRRKLLGIDFNAPVE